MRTLDPDRWRALSPHLDDALEMPAAERESWLAALRAREPALAADLQMLLAQHAVLDEAGFLERSVSPALPIAKSSSSETTLAGQTLGAYTLISHIGHGGMGSVWLARRSDGRFEGFAAVKLLNASLMGRAGEERFTREGTILARLSHPFIAHLIDAGVSPGGQPYLVLEYVQGEHIDRYCDERRLSLDERIRLFLDVLSAVAHAHANLVVHRDLKPSNVLVRTDPSTDAPDGHRVKLLDFGIAKLLEQDPDFAATALLTENSGWALTPAFAAPEQLTGGTVTTATDVYSLGVLLYILLGGRHPAGSGLRSPADLISVVVDTEAPRLSDALARTGTEGEEALLTSAARRSTTPEKLRRALQGDLETIVATALKKDPRERYPSVTALADDLQRYLDERPIRARPDTWSYRAAKFVRRNRLVVTLAALAAVALGAGVAGTITQARRAERQAVVADAQRDFALRQLSRAEAINDLNAFLLSDAAPSGKPFTVGDLLARAERIVDHSQGESLQNRVELLVTIGRQYQGQDEHDKARRVLAQAYELAAALPEPTARARAGCAYASAIALAGETERAEALFQSSYAALPAEPQFALDRVTCLMLGSDVAEDRGDMPRLVERVEAAQRLVRATPLAPAVMDLNVSMRLAEAYRVAARFREAAAGFETAFARLTALGRADTERAGTLLNNWGMVLSDIGRPLEAERAFRRVIGISSVDGTDGSVSPMLLNNLARTLRDLDRLTEAREYAERAYAKARRMGQQVVIDQSLIQRSAIYRGLGDLTGAARMLAELEARVTQNLPAGHIAFAALAAEQALLAAARGEMDVAIARSDRSLAIAQANGQRLAYMSRYLVDRANIELQMQRPDEARAHAAQALALEQAAAGPGAISSRIGIANLALGRALLGQGRLAEAHAALASVIEHLTPTLGADHPSTRLARKLVAGSSTQ
jgi:serine/threonine-protein kinase